MNDRDQNASASGRAAARIDAIDVVRGVAVALIFLVHMLQRFLASLPPKGIFGRNPGVLNNVFMLVEALVSSKGFTIFSILFGLGMFMMMSSADRKGVEFRRQFLWRMAILFVIGYVHALFFRGDILTTYALLGVALMPLSSVSNKTLAILIFVMLSGLPRYVLYYFLQGEPWLPGSGGAATTAINTTYHAAVTQGDLLDVFRSNAWDGHLWFFYIQFDMIGRAYLAFAYFLMGLWLGRIAFFDRLDALAIPIRRAFFLSIALAVPVMGVSFYAARQLFAKGFVINSWSAVFTLTGMNLTDTLIAIAIFCGTLMAYRTGRGKWILAALAPYGRMPLSNYFMQSVIGTFLFYHWGLGLMGVLQSYQVATVAVVLIALQVWFSVAWMRQFQFGPLEWLWRSATHRRWQPMLRMAPAPALGSPLPRTP